MKVKIDFVTNSSSESFGIVAIDTVASVVSAGGLLVLIEAAKGMLSGSLQGSALSDAQSMAQEIAAGAESEADFQEAAVMEGYSEAEKTIDSEAAQIQKEIDEYSQLWAESDKTADKTDPGYDKLKQQYEAYIKHLQDSLKQKDYEKHLVQVQKAEEKAAIEAKGEWMRQRQVDLIAVKEEKALLIATQKGYGSAGYNVAEIERRLKQLDENEKRLTTTLAENDALIEYTARDRGSVGPGAAFDKMVKDLAKQKADAEKAMIYANAGRRAEIAAKIAKAEAELAQAMKSANRWDLATKAAEGVQFGADVAIDALSHITGPAGKQIKLAYTAGKGVAGGLGEGMADPKNAGKHIAKGIIGAVTEVAKDRFQDGRLTSKMKSALAGMANEAAQGGLDASIKGEGVLEGAVKGVGKGALDAVTEHGLETAIKKAPAALTSRIPMPKGTSVDVGDMSVSQILNNNPLSKGLLKTGGREFIWSKGKDMVKGALVDATGTPLGFVDKEGG
ncbi:MAG: hypothetical protein KGZ66_09625 [Selenomonadales bacterium]|jgi:hypothetical protein|nr:hypothetical protein [Selenomonadales bacterium]